MRLGILCSGDLGGSILKKLAGEYKVDFVFTDKNSTEIINYCHINLIDVFVGNPRNNKANNFLLGKDIDVLISVNYIFIIEEDLIKLPQKTAFNIHGSLLPKYRGRTPHVWAIINNEIKTGISAHLIDKGCDTGDIIEQVEVEIRKDDTGATILEKYKAEYYPLIKRVLNDIENNSLKTKKQNHNEATYFGKRTPNDGLIDWNSSKKDIYNWIRAQAYPYPGAFTYIEEKKITIDKVEILEDGNDIEAKNGQIIQDSPNIIVKVKDGLIRISQIREDKNILKKNLIFLNNDDKSTK